MKKPKTKLQIGMYVVATPVWLGDGECSPCFTARFRVTEACGDDVEFIAEVITGTAILNGDIRNYTPVGEWVIRDQDVNWFLTEALQYAKK